MTAEYAALGLSVLCLMLYVPGFNGLPVGGDTAADDPGTHHLTDDEAADYLERYGYMARENDDPDSPLGQLQAHDVTSAILAFQRMYGLAETGQIDEETRRWMEMPRCGISDVVRPEDTSRRKKRYTLQGSRWGKSTLSYRISDYPDNDVSRSDTDSEIRRAFQVWADVVPLSFDKRTSGYVDIDVLFGSGYHGDNEPFDGRGNVLAHAYFPQYGGDVHFDDDESWSLRSYRGTNLFQVAAHEVGHSLGLGHSNVRDALMAPFYKGYDPNFRLHSDDISGIRRLYGTRMNTPAPAPPTESATNPPRPTQGPPRPPEPPVSQPPPGVPDFCSNAQFDAVTLHEIDGEAYTFVFQGDYYARLSPSGMDNGYPRRISDDWNGLPGNLDAALYWETLYEYSVVNGRWAVSGVQRPGRTYFFKGDKYWRYENMQLVNGYPRTIAQYWRGLPDNLDAAFVWSGNERTYFIKDGQYYRYTSGVGVDYGYPRSLSLWRGLPAHIDGAMQWVNSRTYFFKDTQYYRFDDAQFRVDSNNYPREANFWWLGCTGSSMMDEETGYIGGDNENDESEEREGGKETGSGSHRAGPHYGALLVSLAVLVLRATCY